MQRINQKYINNVVLRALNEDLNPRGYLHGGQLLKWIDEDDRILKDKEPMVVISELADSSVNIMVRAWVKSEDFLDVKFKFNEKVYQEFPQNGLSIPFPQLDVNIKK